MMLTIPDCGSLGGWDCSPKASGSPIQLERISKGDLLLRIAANNHYSSPGGFVGRFLAYAIWCKGDYLGVIVAGSATMHLPGRNEFFGSVTLNRIVSNTLFHRRVRHRDSQRRAER